MIGIVAISENGVIGEDNKIPWYYSDDLKFFRSKTLNNVVIMGRKTWDSFGSHPLPDRLNMVLTSKYEVDNILFYNSIQDILKSDLIKNREVYVIGGSQIYELFNKYINTWYVTRIKLHITGKNLCYFNNNLLDEFKLTNIIKLNDNLYVDVLQRQS